MRGMFGGRSPRIAGMVVVGLRLALAGLWVVSGPRLAEWAWLPSPCGFGPSALQAAEADWSTVAEHFRKGRYAEGDELAAELAPRHPPGPIELRTWSRLLWAQGRSADAEAKLDSALASGVKDARVLAERSWQHWQRGRVAPAEAAALLAIGLNPDEPQARLVMAHVALDQGDLKKAADGYRWFVRFYNRAQPTDAETLVPVARGAAHYARWNSLAQVFDFTVNTLCVDAVKDDPACWEAHLIAGELLLEKYNEPEGNGELDAALAINPRITEVHTLRAANALERLQFAIAEEQIDRALAINSEHVDALRLQVETAIRQGRTDGALARLRRAEQLRPNDQPTLALLAFLAAIEGPEPAVTVLRSTAEGHRPKTPASNSPTNRFPAASPASGAAPAIRHREPQPLPSALTPENAPAATEKLPTFVAVVDAMYRQHPRPGVFWTELGRLFETVRKLPLAEACYLEAQTLMPQLATPKTELGLLYFQSGRLAEARTLLDDAFKVDPYHVRVSNMRKVLRVLDDYATVTTPHFVIRADGQLDALLARYMAEYLEEIYPEITGRFGFEPPQRTQLEIFNKAKGLAGHQWFSARMVGLPWIQTIGASTGLIIAMTSPAATDEPFNWARVLQHEFIHVVTLQQTDFNIPHWYTEALATRSEGYPWPPSWGPVFRQRLTSGNLRNLDNLHLGFQRAENQQDWEFAYCQSVLYADYFVERFGEASLTRLLEAYRQTRSTPVAVQSAFQVSLADLEAGYRPYLEQRAARMTDTLPDPLPAADVVRQQLANRPDDLDVQAQQARLQLSLGARREAQAIAEKVLQRAPQNARAALVLAQIHRRDKDFQAALQILETAWQDAAPHRQLGLLRAQTLVDLDRTAEAVVLLKQFADRYRDDLEWQRARAKAAAQDQNRPELLAAWERLAAIDYDDVKSRKALALAAAEDGDHERLLKYAVMALQIDVLDADIHRLLGTGYHALKRWDRAIAEREVVLQLQPGQVDSELDLAESFLEAGQTAKAQPLITKVLEKMPDHARAKALRARLP